MHKDPIEEKAIWLEKLSQSQKKLLFEEWKTMGEAWETLKEEHENTIAELQTEKEILEKFEAFRRELAILKSNSRKLYILQERGISHEYAYGGKWSREWKPGQAIRADNELYRLAGELHSYESQIVELRNKLADLEKELEAFEKKQRSGKSLSKELGKQLRELKAHLDKLDRLCKRETHELRQ